MQDKSIPTLPLLGVQEVIIYAVNAVFLEIYAKQTTLTIQPFMWN